MITDAQGVRSIGGISTVVAMQQHHAKITNDQTTKT